MATAQLLLYSGAQDPSRELTSQQAVTLAHLLERLAEVVPAPPPTALGPGGASVTWGDAEGPYAGVLVRDGVVTVYRRHADRPEYRLDDVGIEGFLKHCLTARAAEKPDAVERR